MEFIMFLIKSLITLIMYVLNFNLRSSHQLSTNQNTAKTYMFQNHSSKTHFQNLNLFSLEYGSIFCSVAKKIILKTLDLIYNAGLRIEVLKFSELVQLKALLIYVTRKKRQNHTKNKLELSWILYIQRCKENEYQHSKT